ncbi:MAG: DUF378 domain-containing protein [Chlamydiota bacterium]
MLNKLSGLALVFLIIGGLVWGFIGLYRINIVEYIFYRYWIIRIVYVLFGAAFVYQFIYCRLERKKRKSKR